MKQQVLVILTLLLFILSFYLNNITRKKALIELYACKNKNDEKYFISMIDSFRIRIIFDSFTREYMKSKFYFDIDKPNDSIFYLNKINFNRLNNNNKLAYIQLMFQNAIKLNDENLAKKSMQLLIKLDKVDSIRYNDTKEDFLDIYSIKFENCSNLIEKYESYAFNEKNLLKKAEYYFRLGEIYTKVGNSAKAMDSFEQSMKYANYEMEETELNKYHNNLNSLR